ENEHLLTDDQFNPLGGRPAGSGMVFGDGYSGFGNTMHTSCSTFQLYPAGVIGRHIGAAWALAGLAFQSSDWSWWASSPKVGGLASVGHQVNRPWERRF